MLIITTILKILSINNERLEYNCLFTVAARAGGALHHFLYFGPYKNFINNKYN